MAKLYKKSSLNDDARPGSPLDAVEKSNSLILDDTRLRKRQLAGLLSVSKVMVFIILHECLGMIKFSTKWVPRMLSPLVMHIRVERCEYSLAFCGNEPYLIIDRLGSIIIIQTRNKSQCSGILRARAKVTHSANKNQEWQLFFWGSQVTLLIDHLNKCSG